MDEATVRMAAQMWAIVAEMRAVEAQVEGMKAENQARMSCGHALAYNEGDFVGASSDLQNLANRLRTEV